MLFNGKKWIKLYKLIKRTTSNTPPFGFILNVSFVQTKNLFIKRYYLLFDRLSRFLGIRDTRSLRAFRNKEPQINIK